MLTASSGKGRASIALAVPNPDGVQAGPVHTPAPLPSRLWPLLVAALVFFAGAALAAAVMLLARPEPNAIAQLKYFEQLKASRGGGAQDLDPESVRGRVVHLAGAVASKGGFDSAIRQALERAGLPLRSVEYMVMHSSAVVIVGVLVQLLTRNLLVTGLLVVFMALGPILLLSFLGDRRSAAFQEQLPDVLNLLASSLRAGWGLQQAVSVVVSELGPPAAPEFERVVTESRLGIPLEDALEKMAVRMESEDFKWAVTAIAIQREVGGNLSEVLDMVASTIRERAMLRRQISSLTAEGRLSAIILIALPFVEAGALWMMNPGYFRPLVASPYGLVTMVFGLVLLAVGIVWLRSVVKIEV
jgi:tight adherence protein B